MLAMRTAQTAIAVALAAVFASGAASALQVTDLANLGKMPHGTETSIGAKLRVYKDLAYSTRDDQADEGKGYKAGGRGNGTHRSGT